MAASMAGGWDGAAIDPVGSQPPVARATHTALLPLDTRRSFAAIAGLVAFAFVLILPTMLRDGDTGWHLAAGRWIIAHGRVPGTDPFSFSAVGRAWVAHEWLAEVAMYAAFAVGGWSGLIVLFATAAGLLYATLALHLTRSLSRPAAAAALALVTIGVLPSLLARPHLLALPILAIWSAALIEARRRDSRPPLAWAGLMLVWANMHGSFVLGLGLAGAFALEAILAAAPSARPGTMRDWSLFGLVTLVAALTTPSGMDGLLFPFQVGRLELLGELREWQPADFSSWSGTQVLLLATLSVLLLRPVRIPPVRVVLLLGLLHMALQHTRQEMVLVVVGALLPAEPVGIAWRHAPVRPVRAQPDARTAIATVVLLAFALAGYRLAVPVEREDAATVPATALARLPAGLRTRPVFNSYSFGGALILAGIRPYIDGRSDMYGDAFSLDYFRIARGDAARWRAADARWRFGWTILSPNSRLVPLLDADPRWRRAYRDGVAVIHVRR